MLWFLGVLVLLALLVAPWWALIEARRARREVERLRSRMSLLEYKVEHRPLLEQVPDPSAEPATTPPAPIPITAAPPVARVADAIASAPTPAPTAPPLPPEIPTARDAHVPSPPAPARAAFDSSRVEEMIGGIWLQNVGSILLLLGVFFLILWGYTTGRMGPEVLVAAGAVLGIALVWRGGVIARSLPAFGHAVIGVGLGIVYLALYLGHFTLHVLDQRAAFSLLALVSIASVVVGLRHDARTIAALGVIGAFLPQLIAAWVPLRGFSLPAPGLLAYMALVNVVVFALAATAGWTSLDLTSLVITTATWIATFGNHPWSLGVEIGLCALYLLLGLAPLPRLVARSTFANHELLVVAGAPMFLILASWPFFAAANPRAVAVLLLSLSAVYMLAAWWVDTRRSERDLWRPLTGAAILFMTGALQRAVGYENTAMAWCAEGAVLVWLGLQPRNQWLRYAGYAVEAIGALCLFITLETTGRQPDLVALANAPALRDLFCLIVIFVVAALTSRRRDDLGPGERLAPEAWTGIGNLLLMIWSGREASHLSHAFEGRVGRWSGGAGGSGAQMLTAAFTACAWIAQAWVLFQLGIAGARRALPRFCAYIIATLAGVVLLICIAFVSNTWSGSSASLFDPFGIATLLGTLGLIAIGHEIGRARPHLGDSELRMHEVVTTLANVVMLAWSAREAPRLAIAISPAAGSARAPGVATVGAVITSGAWTIQAAVLLALGWAKSSPFLRWLGLALFGLTVLKFLFVDLQQVDVFWRFLTAIVVGLVLLAVSYFYQRRRRNAQGT
jgi:uncharacterized membrane protein